MLKISCYSSSSYGNERIARIWQRGVCIRGCELQRGCRSIKQPILQPPGNTAGGAEPPLIEGRWGGATEFSPIRVLLCFLLPTNDRALLARQPSSPRRLPLSQPISRRLLRSFRGDPTPRAVPPCPSPPLLRGPAPPREGAKSVTHRAGGGGRAPAGLVRSAPAEAVPSPLAPDCPLRRLRSLPLCLPTRGCRGQSDRASRGLRLPGAGNGAPWLQPLSEHRCGAGGGVCSPCCSRRRQPGRAGPRHPEPPAGLKAPPPGSPRRRRHLAGRWGRGREGDREGEGWGAVAGGTLWGLGVRRLGPTEGVRTCRWRKTAELSQSQAHEGKGPTDK